MQSLQPTRKTLGLLLGAGSVLLAISCGGTMAFQGQSALSIMGDPPAPPPPPPEEAKPPPRVELRDDRIVINEKVQFEYAKARIMEQSHDLLNEVASTIKEHKHIKKIRVEGHASSEGSADFNRKLSDDRAKAVMAYLVSQGIPQGALEAKGYGSDKPIASNDAEAGREKNRRVEFNIIEQDVTQKKVEVDPVTGKEKVIETKQLPGDAGGGKLERPKK